MGSSEQIRNEALYWIEQVNRPVVDTAQNTRFDAWMRADPRHADSFARLQALWDSPAVHTALDDPDLMLDADGEDLAANDASAVPPVHGRRLWLAGGVAAVMLAAATPIALMPGTTQHVETARGAGATAILADGSRVELAPGTKLAAEFRPWSRTVTLVRGEAFFDVRHEAWRSFEVASGENIVRVLGTSFNVDRTDGDNMFVQVFAGKVAMGRRDGALMPVEKGKAAHLSGKRLTISRLDPLQQKPAWMDGWFEASNTPLAVLIDRLNRYSPKPVIVRREDLLRRNITGRFRVQDVDETLQALEAAYALRRTEGSRGIILE